MLCLLEISIVIPLLLEAKIAIALPEAEAFKRLDAIPVFAVTNQEGIPILASIPNPKDRTRQIQVATFFLSQQDAQALIEKLKSSNPSVGMTAKTTSLSMRQAYDLKVKNKYKSESLVFEFLPPKQQIDAAISVLRKNGQNVRQYNDVPLFYGTGGRDSGLLTIEQKNKKVIPFYFSKQDLQGMLAQLEKKDPQLSSTVKVEVTSLSKVLDSLLKENSAGIQQIILVPDKYSLQYALKQQKSSSSQIALNPSEYKKTPISENENQIYGNKGRQSPKLTQPEIEERKDMSNQTASRSVNTPLSVTTPKSSEDIYQIATEVTVSIEGTNNGSGVLIAKDSGSYYVLTCKHVVSQEDTYTIVTSDNSRHSVNYRSVKLLPNFDLAIVEFTSNERYRLAQINASQQTRQGESIYISGFTSRGLAIKLPTQLTSEGRISGFQRNEPEGYELLYSNVTAPGMSGGPILNESGQVIGIHGRAEGNSASGGKVGINLGIPINFFIKTAPQVGINLQKLKLKAER